MISRAERTCVSGNDGDPARAKDLKVMTRCFARHVIDKAGEMHGYGAIAAFMARGVGPLGSEPMLAQTTEMAMADDRSITAPQDGKRINVKEDPEIRYWTNRFGVSAERLKAAVSKVGVSVDAVAGELEGQ